MTTDTRELIERLIDAEEAKQQRDPQAGERFLWGKDEVSVMAISRGVGEAITFRRLRDDKTLQCGLSYFLRMADRP